MRAERTPTVDRQTRDSFVNFAQKVGRASGNPSARGSYSLYPITRFRVELEWAYRGSWIVRKAVDAVPEDMIRAGIDLGSDIDPKDGDRIQRAMVKNGTWRQFLKVMKLGRLYGGAIAVPIIDGQDFATPLRIDRVGKGQYKGIVVLDRWQLFPSYEDLVTAADPVESTDEIGLPRFYRVTGQSEALPNAKIHYSRAWRFGGAFLPYWQRLTENLWDESVVEVMFDRLIAFDSATQGAAQLVYRAYLRTFKVAGLTDILGQDPSSPAYQALLNRTQAMRDLQVSEGLTIVDAEDDVLLQAYTFAGLSDIILQFGQQLAGAEGIPLVRLFGQSPTGLSATGESDMNNYYETVDEARENLFRMPCDKAVRLTGRNLGIELDDEFWWDFTSLKQLDQVQKVDLAQKGEQIMADALDRGIFTNRVTALKELKQMSRITGIFTNITNEDIEAAEKEAEAAPPPGEMQPGGAGAGLGHMMLGDPGEAPEPDLPAGSPAPMGRPGEEKLDRRPRLSLVADAALWASAGAMRGFDFQGLPIFIETAKGERRRSDWPPLPADYGYVRGTGSAEGAAEGVDCFVGPNRDSTRAWIVNQVNPETGTFDEVKLMLGFASRNDALDCYTTAYGGPAAALARVGGIVAMDIEQLKVWLQSHPVTEAA